MTGLNYAGASGALTGSVVAVLITVGLAAVAYGRLGAPGAVQLTVDRDTVHFGDETHGVVSYQLASLVAMSQD
ncbi:hypothetical protein RBA16_25265, partial [Mycobacteroides abscessus subsp. massiliense]